MSLTFVYDSSNDIEEFPEVDLCGDFKQGCIKKVLATFGMLSTFPRVTKCITCMLKKNYSPLNEDLAVKMKEISANMYKIAECFEQSEDDNSEAVSK